ncbi:hypothetical protein [Aureimonas leprariae]|uniref:Peptidase M50 domain-containing protein n=1 Tax=Plantimonas leprariae TaxID=2615207 RepID=A0A7V7TWB8_9HYPH|nr:hypothetical protein [Aureimonas leprariae]KAB0679351.1 hypothetical protein F6X38_13530 [Aureimonas leprariae]
MRKRAIWFDGDRGAIGFRLPNDVPVYLYATFALPVVIMGIAFLLHGGSVGRMLALLVAPVLFLSMLVHETAHMAVAHRQGLATSEILIFDAGGLALIELPGNSAVGWRIALAGPLANLAVGAALLLLHAALPEPLPQPDPRFTIPPPVPPSLLSEACRYVG